MIWYEKTLKRNHNEKIEQAQVDWSRTANEMAMMHNTAMGAKKTLNPKKLMPEFKGFEESINDSKENLIDKAKKLGLKTPKVGDD